MNKLKNIGISALAGTLVSLSAAQAGGITVTGNWEISYTNLNHSKVTGNKIGVNKNMGFGASGDISDGGGVTWGTTLGMSDAMGLSSASMNINMGGIATLAYDSGTGGYGANSVDNIVPTAWEEIDYGLSTGITDLGAVSASKGAVTFKVKTPVAGTGLSISYASRMSAGHNSDGATGGDGIKGVDMTLDFVDYNSPHFGARWGMSAEYMIPEVTCSGQRKIDNPEHMFSCAGAGQAVNVDGSGHKGNPYGGSMFMKLALGPLHLGTQATFKDPMDPTRGGFKNKRAIIAGAALVFGDKVSISYGEAWDRYKYNNAARGGDVAGFFDGQQSSAGGADINGKGGEYEMIKYQGWSAALNLGPVAIKGTKNTVGGWGEGSSNTGEGLDKSHSEINLSIAF